MRRLTTFLPLLPCACAAPLPQGGADSAHERPQDLAFPRAWVGTWRGQLVCQQRPSDGAAAATQTVGLTLAIGPADVDGAWPWRLTYDGQPTRDYRLRVVDAAAGQWVIDEGGGLVLAATWLDGTLVTRFAVGGSLLFTRQRFFADRIEHEIWTGPSGGARVGGGVDAYDVTAVQRAVLRRAP